MIMKLELEIDVCDLIHREYCSTYYELGLISNSSLIIIVANYFFCFQIDIIAILNQC